MVATVRDGNDRLTKGKLQSLWGLGVEGEERLQSPIGIFRVQQRLPANARNPLAKDLSIKEMLNFRRKDSRWLTVTRGSKSVWRTCLAF